MTKRSQEVASAKTVHASVDYDAVLAGVIDLLESALCVEMRETDLRNLRSGLEIVI